METLTTNGGCEAGLRLNLKGRGEQRPCNNSMYPPCFNFAGVEGELRLGDAERPAVVVPLSGQYRDCTRCPFEPVGATFERAWPGAIVGGLAHLWGQPLVASALADEVESIRLAAVAVAVPVGPRPEDAVPNLVRATFDREWTVRNDAVVTLGALGDAAGTAVPTLATTLGDPDWLVRQSAAEALAKLGPAALPALKETLQHGDNPEARLAAARGLALMGAPAATAVPALLSVLGNASEDAFLRAWAAEALGKVGQAARPAVPELITALGDPNQGVRESAGRALTAITGHDLGGDQPQWQRWWEENKP